MLFMSHMICWLVAHMKPVSFHTHTHTLQILHCWLVALRLCFDSLHCQPCWAKGKPRVRLTRQDLNTWSLNQQCIMLISERALGILHPILCLPCILFAMRTVTNRPLSIHRSNGTNAIMQPGTIHKRGLNAAFIKQWSLAQRLSLSLFSASSWTRG